MGLFGFIKKGIVGLAKVGLSKLTGGLSDKAFMLLKDRKQKAQADFLLAQMQLPTIPMLRPPTEKHEGEGWDLGRNVIGSKRRAYFGKLKAPAKGSLEALSRERMALIEGAIEESSAEEAATKLGVKRAAAPKGGLDLTYIAALWKEQGKPGTWKDFIKANSQYRRK